MANMPGAAAGAHYLAAAPAQTWSRDAPLARRSNDSDEPRILFLPGPQSIAGIPGYGDLKGWVVDRGGPRADGPTLDADGLLRFAGLWVSIPDTQLPVVDLLVRNMGRLVRSADIRQAYEQGGGSGSDTSLRSLIYRVGRRVTQVGLRLRVVRSRGVVLDTTAAL